MAKKKRQLSKGKVSNKTAKTESNNRLFKILVVVFITLIFVLTVIIINLWDKDSQSTLDSKTTGGMFAAPEFKKQAELTFFSFNSEIITKIDIEIADSDTKKQIGMMHRDKMKDSQGMLFIFPEEDTLSFWMRNTILSLDMIFVNADGEIVTIHKNTTPFAATLYKSDKPAIYVIEVNAGFADKYNINIGDKITWKRN